jgi:hypothetical protein
MVSLFKKLERSFSKIFSPIFERADSHFFSIVGELRTIERRIEFLQEAIGRVEARQLKNNPDFDLNRNEFRVFSQWGDDGIIQYLVSNIEIPNRIFVEFGMDNYNMESNTRFLLSNNNWSGLVIDSDLENISRLKNSPTYWLYNLKVQQAFISKENINDILKENGVFGEIGLLSIDIDGNDFWIWEAIDVIDPVIVIAEYNHRFGKDLSVSIPYTEDFRRDAAHPSKMYFGASLKAICTLANRKGYDFLGCNINGVNAYFVRKDRRPDYIKACNHEEGFIPGSFSEMTFKNGVPEKTSPEDESAILVSLDLPLVNID